MVSLNDFQDSFASFSQFSKSKIFCEKCSCRPYQKQRNSNGRFKNCEMEKVNDFHLALGLRSITGFLNGKTVGFLRSSKIITCLYFYERLEIFSQIIYYPVHLSKMSPGFMKNDRKKLL